MSVNIMPVVKQQFNQNGVPLAGGKLFTYAAGTSNKLATYTDSTGLTPNTNPIILDANGQADVWMTAGDLYKFILSPASDTDPPTNPYWTEDNISGVNDVSFTPGSLVTSIYVAGGSGQYSFVPGVTTALTLPNDYSLSNLQVFFDVAYQGPDQILSLSGETLTFTAPIPVGTKKVYVIGGLQLGTLQPGNSTVGPAQLVPQFGSTANRPTPLYTGQFYFDVTLGQPIWANASATGWVNAAGVAV